MMDAFDPLLRSLLSQQVADTELGNVFGAVACVESICQLLMRQMLEALRATHAHGMMQCAAAACAILGSDRQHSPSNLLLDPCPGF